jgi:hypothetical protein
MAALIFYDKSMDVLAVNIVEFCCFSGFLLINKSTYSVPLQRLLNLQNFHPNGI